MLTALDFGAYWRLKAGLTEPNKTRTDGEKYELGDLGTYVDIQSIV